MPTAVNYITTAGQLELQAAGVGGLLGVSVDLCTAIPSPPALNATISSFTLASYTGYGADTIALTDGFVDPASQLPYALSGQPRWTGPSDSTGQGILGYVVQWHTASASVPVVGMWGSFSAGLPELVGTDCIALTFLLGADLTSQALVIAPGGLV